MDETKRFIIDTIYNARGLKRYTADMNRARRVAKVFGIGLSKQAKILEKTTSMSWNKQGEAVKRTTTIMEDQGKRVRTVYDNLGQHIKCRLCNQPAITSEASNTFRNPTTRYFRGRPDNLR